MLYLVNNYEFIMIELKKCCFCCPLRHGIMLFGLINILFSLGAVAALVFTTELKKSTLMNDSSLEVVTSTVLFSIFGMSVILNILLLVAGSQKDISMLRLYNYYAVAITLTALVPTFILLSRKMYYDVTIALIAIGNILVSLVMQYYVVVLVRSEIVKLELKERTTETEQQQQQRYSEEDIDVADVVTLL